MLSKSRLLAAAAPILLAIALTGCNAGGGTDSPSGAAAEVPADFYVMVQQGMKAPTGWTGPTEGPVATAVKRRIVSIPCNLAAYGCKRIDDGVHAAGDAIGWEIMTIDPKGDVDATNKAIDQAIQLRADGIVLAGPDPEVVKAAVQRARNAGVAVMGVAAGREPSETGINHDVSLKPFEQGQLLAAYTVVESEGTAQVGVLQDSEFANSVQRLNGFMDIFKQCSGCSIVNTVEFKTTDIGTQLGSKSQSFLQSNPSVEYAWVALDGAAADVVIAAQQVGGSQVRVISFDANPQNIQFLIDGKQFADIGTALDWDGWAAVDNLNRIFAGKEPVKDDGIPIQLITKDNAGDFAENGYQGGIDFAAKYVELWTTGATDASAVVTNR